MSTKHEPRPNDWDEIWELLYHLDHIRKKCREFGLSGYISSADDDLYAIFEQCTNLSHLKRIPPYLLHRLHILADVTFENVHDDYPQVKAKLRRICDQVVMAYREHETSVRGLMRFQEEAVLEEPGNRVDRVAARTAYEEFCDRYRLPMQSNQSLYAVLREAFGPEQKHNGYWYFSGMKLNA